MTNDPKHAARILNNWHFRYASGFYARSATLHGRYFRARVQGAHLQVSDDWSDEVQWLDVPADTKFYSAHGREIYI